MNFELKLAFKYFRARRKSLARFTAMVAIVGIACGVASLIVGQALTRGFRNEMQEKILSNTAHVTVFQTNGEAITDWQNVKGELQKLENVSEVSPTTYESAVIIGEKAAAYGVLRAIESSNSPNPITNDIEVALGAQLAEKTGLKSGDETQIILPPQAAGLAPKNAVVRVTGTFHTGIYDYDATWIHISFQNFARVQDKTNFEPTVLSVTVKDIYAADKTAENIRENLSPDFKVIDWQTANQPLFAALSLEKKVSFAVISLVVFIAVLNITTTLSLLVNERKLDIAVLRTCGARTRNLVFIFLLEGLILALIGVVFGVAMGLTACSVANYFELIGLQASVYSLSYVPLTVNLSDILFIVSIAFLLSLAASVYPAWRAAKIKPLENLRTQ